MFFITFINKIDDCFLIHIFKTDLPEADAEFIGFISDTFVFFSSWLTNSGALGNGGGTGGGYKFVKYKYYYIIYHILLTAL